MLTEDFMFSSAHPGKYRNSAIDSATRSYHMLSISLFINHTLIRRYIVRGTDSFFTQTVNKYPTKNDKICKNTYTVVQVQKVN
jgi:hypothetical protein